MKSRLDKKISLLKFLLRSSVTFNEDSLEESKLILLN